MSKRRKTEDFYEDEDLSDLDTKSFGKDTLIQYHKIKNKLQKSEPDIVSILNSDFLEDDKQELFELFEIYKIIDSPSLEKMELKKKIHEKIATSKRNILQYKKYTKKEHEHFEKEMFQLDQYDKTKELKYEIINLKTTDQNKKVIYYEYKKMISMSSDDGEKIKLQNWLDWAISLPYDRIREPSFSDGNSLTKILQKTSRRMDEELYGMQKIKEQILLFLNSRLLNPNMKKCSLGLLGPPGCGKTTIVKILADILDIPLQQISLGGVQSSDFLKGHLYTYIGSQPGEIVKSLRRMGVKNGILFFDEYDKISSNKEVSSALLHITDSSQNNNFQDNFLNGISIDLSSLWFFYSMNEKPKDDALADRIFYVTIDPYTNEDKFFIVKDYLLRKAQQNVGISPESIVFSDQAIRYLIETVSDQVSGIRALENAITSLVNKINFLYRNTGGNFNLSFNLGKKIFFPFRVEKETVIKLLPEL